MKFTEEQLQQAAEGIALRRAFEERSKRVKPSIGRVVHYVLKEGRSKGQHRAAVITNAFATPDHANMRVLLDSTNDEGNEFGTLLEGHAFSAHYDESGVSPGSWHWPERVE